MGYVVCLSTFVLELQAVRRLLSEQRVKISCGFSKTAPPESTRVRTVYAWPSPQLAMRMRAVSIALASCRTIRSSETTTIQPCAGIRESVAMRVSTLVPFIIIVAELPCVAGSAVPGCVLVCGSAVVVLVVIRKCHRCRKSRSGYITGFLDFSFLLATYMYM